MGHHIDMHNPKLMDLLKRLHASFGIGVIDLRTDEDKSAILLNAKYKEKIDYTVALELSEKMKSFLKSVVDYDPNHQHRYKDEFDEVKKKEELYPNSSLSFKRFKRLYKGVSKTLNKALKSSTTKQSLIKTLLKHR